MGIQCPLLPSADCCSGYFQVLFLKNFPSLGHTPPLPPRFYVLYPLFQGQALLLLGAAQCTFIGHGPATARAYSDILLVQYPDCLRLVVFPEPSQELTAADQVPAYGDQLPLVLVA